MRASSTAPTSRLAWSNATERSAELPAEALEFVAVALGAAAQAVTGMGFALVAAPALIGSLGPRDGVSVVIFLAAIASLVPLARYRASARLGDVARLLLPALVVTPLAALALGDRDQEWLAVAAGVAVLAGVGALAAGVRWAWLRRRGGAVGAGVVSGILNVIGGVGGPPVGLYAANAGWSADAIRGTLQAFFLAQSIGTLAVLGVVLPRWPLVVALLLGAGLGVTLGGRVGQATTRAGVLGLSALGGVALIVGSL